MTKQRLISDARRRARALSIETGRPYQSHLDDVARMAGRQDWKAFVDDPAAMAPVEPVDPSVARRPSASATRNRIACIAGAAFAAALPIAAAAAILADSDRMNEQSARVSAEGTMLSHVHAPLSVDGGPRTLPARIQIKDVRRRVVTLAYGDMRVAGASRFLRYMPGHEPILFVGDKLGGDRMRDALSNGAVMRMVIEVDCADSTARHLRWEAGRDMTSAPVYAKDVPKPLRTYRIASATAAREVCGAPETPPIMIY